MKDGAESDLPREQASDFQRARIVSATVRISSVHGTESATVARVVAAAGVSRSTFYEVFDDREDCLRAAFEETVAIATERARAGYWSESAWVDRLRAGLLALLRFFDEEPELARLLVVQAFGFGPATLARRQEVLDALARLIEQGARTARTRLYPQPLAAQSAIGGTLGVLHAQLLKSDRQPLVELLNPLMGMILLPYVGATAAFGELSRRLPANTLLGSRSPLGPNPLEGLPMRLTYRTIRVLTVIAGQPGLSNAEVGRRAGVTDEGQISKLLARLAGLGLVENTEPGQAKGAPNAWRLTERGGQVERTIAREVAR